MYNLFLVYFVKLCMFRAHLGPSSEATTVSIQHLVLFILFRWLAVVLVELFQQSTQDSNWYLLFF